MNFEEMLKELKKEYLSSIPEKITIIQAQIQAGDAHNVRESFHKLKGTGRTYGLPEVSELSEVVERICLQKPANALSAAGLAVAVLRDIHQGYATAAGYNITADTRLQDIRQLL